MPASPSAADKVLNRVMAALLLCGLAGMAVMVARYLVFEGYLDHMEPHVAGLSWDLLQGGDLYRQLDAPGYRVNSYGPGLFLVEALFFKLLGGGVLASKLPGVIALAVAVGAFCFHLYRRHGWFGLGFGGVILVGLLLKFAPMSFWNRPETFLILASAAAVILADRRRDRPGIGTAAAFGALIGAAMAFKLYAFIYFCAAAWPLVSAPLAKGRIAALAALAAGCAAAVFVAAFAPGGIDLGVFFGNLQEMVGGRERSLDSVLALARSAAVYAMPMVVLLVLSAGRRSRLPAALKGELAVLLATFAAMFYPASMPGAGNYYFLPFAPLVASLSVRMMASGGGPGAGRKSIAAMLAVLVLVISVPQQKRLWRVMGGGLVQQGYADLAEARARYPDAAIRIGYGDDFDTYRLSYLAPVLIFAGHPAGIDATSMMELRASGRGRLLGRYEPAFEPCGDQVWLLPKGEAPFALRSYYDGRPLFSDDFRARFSAAFAKAAGGRAFDLWTCRASGD